MTENNANNIDGAFEMLLEEVEAEIDFVTRIGSQAFENRNFPKVDEARERAQQVSSFRDKAAALRKEWEQLRGAQESEDEATRAERRNLGRLRKGQRTPEAAYYLPILKALNDLGGRAKLKDVLERVYKAMKKSLQDVDLEPLASDPDMPRWRNSAQWARNTMRQEGLIKDDSPHGTWEISDAGRARLRESSHL